MSWRSGTPSWPATAATCSPHGPPPCPGLPFWRAGSPLRPLDDILSEMAASRRRSVIEAVSGYDQLLVTATDLDRFPQEFLDRAAVLSVSAGTVTTLPSHAVTSGGTGAT